MRLPHMKYGSGIAKARQVKFGGLNHTLGAKDGQLWDMKNLTGDHEPLLSTRAPRMLYRTIPGCSALFSWEGLCWVAGTEFFFRGEKKGDVTEGAKTFGSLGAYIVIFPDKAYYNTESGEFGSLEASYTASNLVFGHGTYVGEEAEANSITTTGEPFPFRVGDAVAITGCVDQPDNNKTPIIREISEDGKTLRFYENTFTVPEGADNVLEDVPVTLKRAVPELDFVCTNENRMWGCKGDTLYASKLGDVFNWNVFDGVETDSYAVDTGTAGSFTACISFMGYPTFFKEDRVFKVYGSRPSNFEVLGSASLGVLEGCAGSLAVASETLFYLSRAGIVAYSGGLPSPVGDAFGVQRFVKGTAGSDGLKYYASLYDGEGWRLYVYDTRSGMWHIEDETQIVCTAYHDGNLYLANDEGEVWISGTILEPPAEATAEEPFDWYAEFADFTDDSPNKKGVGKVQLRIELDAGAQCRVLIQMDSDGVWEQVGRTLTADVKRSYYLPIIPRRCDHYRLRLEGTGQCRVHSMVRELYVGSELKSKTGGN